MPPTPVTETTFSVDELLALHGDQLPALAHAKLLHAMSRRKPAVAFDLKPTRIYWGRREGAAGNARVVVGWSERLKDGQTHDQLLSRRHEFLDAGRQLLERDHNWGYPATTGESLRLAFDLLCDAAGPVMATWHYRRFAAYLRRELVNSRWRMGWKAIVGHAGFTAADIEALAQEIHRKDAQ